MDLNVAKILPENSLLLADVPEKFSSKFVSYVNTLTSWWPPEAIAGAIGVPTYAHNYSYNIINLSFWTTNQGPVDAAFLWSNAINYVSADNPWGKTTQEVQKTWINLYHQKGVKVLVSAFGATNFPTSEGADPMTVAEKLASFVKANNLDGVDLDWEDNAALENSTGEEWLIKITQTLRKYLPREEGYIISHAPQGPYFMGSSKYPAGGYLKVNEIVGDLIDFYNIQFYNQDSTTYDTFDSLFIESNGWATNTAVQQIAKSVDKNKLVVGNPVLRSDAANTGYVPVSDLVNFLQRGVNEGFIAGFMGWQYSSDSDGSWSVQLANIFPQNKSSIYGIVDMTTKKAEIIFKENFCYEELTIKLKDIQLKCYLKEPKIKCKKKLLAYSILKLSLCYILYGKLNPKYLYRNKHKKFLRDLKKSSFAQLHNLFTDRCRTICCYHKLFKCSE